MGTVSVKRVLLSVSLAVVVLGLGSVVALGEHEGRKHGGGGATNLPPAADKQVSYVKDVKPIFVESCHDCHADGAHKGGYRMDTRDQVLKEGAVVVGNSARSKMVRMMASGGEEKMPPKGKALTAEQVGIVRAWIDQGAKWDDTDKPTGTKK